MRSSPLAALLVLAIALPCHAKNHLWKFTEFFSNLDGTIQFIEMQECCGNDRRDADGHDVIQSDAHTFAFPNNLIGHTAHRWVLIATQRFANLPGAPTPDYIMPDHFFHPGGDTLRYRFGTDIVVLQPGALPHDGPHSLDRNLTTGALSVIVNDPINFAGATARSRCRPGFPVGARPRGGSRWACVAAIGASRLRRRAPASV